MIRQPTYSVELVEAVLKLREGYTRWGKDKLVILLYRAGFDCSASMVGRMLPKINGHVEKAQRTPTEEFYEVTDASFEIGKLNQTLLEWEKVYNTI